VTPLAASRRGARRLAAFWAVLLAAGAAGALVLQWLGPPPAAHAPRPSERAARPEPTHEATRAPAPALRPASAPVQAAAAGIAAPDPALLEPAPDFSGRVLPKIGADGRRPEQLYAGHAGLPAHGPQIAILLDGVGLDGEQSQQAIASLPPAISFALSPYADSVSATGANPLLDAIRHSGHEMLLSLPMEPDAPGDDEGNEALSTQTDLAHNQQALEWALSRFSGYVGVTNALSGQHGERYAGSIFFPTVAEALRRRGLMYADAWAAPHPVAPLRREQTPHIVQADLVLDEAPDAADIEARLSRLEQIATTRGSAFGVAGPLRPVLLDQLRLWSRHLAERGITLVPVSALPPPRTPPTVPPKKSPT